MHPKHLHYNSKVHQVWNIEKNAFTSVYTLQIFCIKFKYAHSVFTIPLASCSYTTLGTCFAFDCLKKEVLAVKKVKSSLSSSRLQYPLLMLLLPVICGDGSSLGVSLHGSPGGRTHHSRLQGWEGEDGLGAGDHRFRWRARSPRVTGNKSWNLQADAQQNVAAGICCPVPVSTGHKQAVVQK